MGNLVSIANQFRTFLSSNELTLSKKDAWLTKAATTIFLKRKRKDMILVQREISISRAEIVAMLREQDPDLPVIGYESDGSETICVDVLRQVEFNNGLYIFPQRFNIICDRIGQQLDTPRLVYREGPEQLIYEDKKFALSPYARQNEAGFPLKAPIRRILFALLSS